MLNHSMEFINLFKINNLDRFCRSELEDGMMGNGDKFTLGRAQTATVSWPNGRVA